MRTKKALKNAFFSIAYQLVAVICGLITPRLILRAFGSTYNGVISSANQFLSMISILTLGIAGATRVALYKPLADHDRVAVSRIIKSNKQYMHKVGIAIVLYAGLLSVVYPFISHNDLSAAESAALISIVSVGTFAQYFFGITSQTLLSADQSGYIYHIVQSCATIANTILTVILIRLGADIFLVKLGSAVVFFLSPIILNLIVRKKYALVGDCEPDPTAIRQRGAVAFHSIANIIHNHTDLLILTVFADAKIISVYTVYQLIIGKIQQIILMLTSGLEGAFGNMWVKHETAAFQRNFRFFEYLIFASSSIAFSTVGVMVIPFVRLYTAGVHDTNYLLVSFAMLFTVTEAMFCIRHPYLIVVQATGNYEATKRAAMAEALINISVSLFLVKLIGLNGVIIGTLIANCFRTIHYALFISKQVIPGSIRGTIQFFIWFLANSALVVLAELLIGTIAFPDGWRGWIANGVLNVIAAAIITALMSYAFCRTQMNQLLRMLRRLIPKRP